MFVRLFVFVKFLLLFSFFSLLFNSLSTQLTENFLLFILVAVVRLLALRTFFFISFVYNMKNDLCVSMHN